MEKLSQAVLALSVIPALGLALAGVTFPGYGGQIILWRIVGAFVVIVAVFLPGLIPLVGWTELWGVSIAGIISGAFLFVFSSSAAKYFGGEDEE